jgi:hypothetical protein
MPDLSTRPARTGSVRVAPWQRQRLGDADRRRIMEAARRLERASYRRGSRRHGGDLRQTGLQVLWTLLYRGWGRAGVCDPSLAQIAAEAHLARSTVQAALERIEAAGIMGHVRRRLCVAGQWVQWTSAYLFAAPGQWRPDTGSRSASVSVERNKLGDKQGRGVANTLAAAERAGLAAKWGLGGAGEAPAAIGA